MKVKKQAGLGFVKVKATSGNEDAHEEIEIDVRPANPVVNEVDMYTLEKGAGKNNDLKFFGMPGTNKVAVELSSVPSIGLEKRLSYLIQYPHGCVEQTTSAAFPQLYVGNMVDLSTEQKKEVAANVQDAIKRLQGFQTSSGGFSYWPGEGNENEWATNYAGHFLVEAEEAGYKVPSHVLSQWKEYQLNKAKNWVPGAYYGRASSGDLVQAYRLFLLALYKSPEIGAMNRLREKADLPTAAKWRLAAAYKLAGQAETAKKITANLPLTLVKYRELSGSFGSDVRDKAMILEALSILGEKAKADAVAKELAEEMRSDRWMSTQETAYSLIALCTYSGSKGSGATVAYSYQIEGGETKVVNASKVTSRIYLRASEFKGKNGLKIVNKGTTKLFVTVITSGIPEEGSKEAKANGLTMKVRYIDLKGNPISPEKILQGTEFEAEVVIKNTNTKMHYREMAITQVFPSGWEIHNVRMDESGFESMARYQDFRDDRVLSYVDLLPNEQKVIRVKLNASYNGKFYLAGVYAEAMYDKRISAYQPGKWVEVSK